MYILYDGSQDGTKALREKAEQDDLRYQQDERSTGRCRYCGNPRPPGYSVTCAGSHCQEAAYNDREIRTPRRRRR